MRIVSVLRQIEFGDSKVRGLAVLRACASSSRAPGAVKRRLLGVALLAGADRTAKVNPPAARHSRRDRCRRWLMASGSPNAGFETAVTIEHGVAGPMKIRRGDRRRERLWPAGTQHAIRRLHGWRLH